MSLSYKKYFLQECSRIILRRLLMEEYHKIANGKIKWKDYSPLTKEEVEKVFGSHLVDAVMQENEKDNLFVIYEKLGAKRSLNDLGVDEKLKDELFFYSPTVRNRLTLMRLRQSAEVK